MLKLRSIKEAGNLAKERVIMDVISEGNIGKHLLLRTMVINAGPRSGQMDAYWFPDRDVKIGDIVVLYSKKGDNRDKEVDGKTTHFFYWGSKVILWDQPARSASLGIFSKWDTIRLGGFDSEADIEPES